MNYYQTREQKITDCIGFIQKMEELRGTWAELENIAEHDGWVDAQVAHGLDMLHTLGAVRLEAYSIISDSLHPFLSEVMSREYALNYIANNLIGASRSTAHLNKDGASVYIVGYTNIFTGHISQRMYVMNPY